MTRAQRNQKILEVIETETKRALASRQTSREVLIREGIYTAAGELRTEFGGPGKKDAAPV